ncbi:MAG: DUF4286 family protein [Muribaculaceae bacterium]|nr:DUF4286 family protein [Muribaculaceae bacterium]
MIIYAVTFMIDRRLEIPFLGWLRGEALSRLQLPATSNPRLTKVAAVPGDPEFARQALSVTLHVDFPSPAPARKWADTYLTPLLDAYTRKFGHEALHFASILQTLPLSGVDESLN